MTFTIIIRSRHQHLVYFNLFIDLVDSAGIHTDVDSIIASDMTLQVIFV